MDFDYRKLIFYGALAIGAYLALQILIPHLGFVALGAALLYAYQQRRRR